MSENERGLDNINLMREFFGSVSRIGGASRVPFQFEAAHLNVTRPYLTTPPSVWTAHMATG